MRPALPDLLPIAQDAARKAGEALLSRHADLCHIESEIGRDIKLKADRIANTIILTHLARAGNIPVLSEESAQTGSGDGIWVVDPLDGTANYLRQLPFCSVSIAYVWQGEPVLGVILDFNRNELYSGYEEGGACLNGAAIVVSAVSEKSRATLLTGLPKREPSDTNTLTLFAETLVGWKKVRMVGSAALATAWVGCGRADAYHEQGTRFWDVAAGAAIVKAAGGRVNLSSGAMDQPRWVSMHNGRLDF